MKINKTKPNHWVVLAAFLLQCVVGLCFRFSGFVRQNRKTVVLYGHKLNGNLLALHNFVNQHPEYQLRLVFLSMDGAYLNKLGGSGVAVCRATRLECAILLAQSRAVISDHGLHSLQTLVNAYQRLGLHFFDVWHGIPFKGFDAWDFRLQQRYNEVWVASDLCQQLYINRFGFIPEQIKVTGYPRTDRLVSNTEDACLIRRLLGIPVSGRVILFAPTWSQDEKERVIYPFGCSQEVFVEGVSRVAKRYGATVLLRTHLNSDDVDADNWKTDNVIVLPASVFPDAEAILQVSDCLVCDWSSIAFDYLLLDRPTIFLDVPPPFRKGFSLGGEYRFGAVVSDFKSLLSQLDVCLGSPEEYWSSYRNKHKVVREEVYGQMADGLSSYRCIQRLLEYT